MTFDRKHGEKKSNWKTKMRWSQPNEHRIHTDESRGNRNENFNWFILEFAAVLRIAQTVFLFSSHEWDLTWEIRNQRKVVCLSYKANVFSRMLPQIMNESFRTIRVAQCCIALNWSRYWCQTSSGFISLNECSVTFWTAYILSFISKGFDSMFVSLSTNEPYFDQIDDQYQHCFCVSHRRIHSFFWNHLKDGRSTTIDVQVEWINVDKNYWKLKDVCLMSDSDHLHSIKCTIFS